jgi:hypothetical protein
MIFLKIYKIFWEELEEKLNKKELELLSLWKILINWDMEISLKINSDFLLIWLKFHYPKPNSTLYWIIMPAKIKLDMFSGKDLHKIWIKYLVWNNYKKHFQIKNWIWQQLHLIMEKMQFHSDNLNQQIK